MAPVKKPPHIRRRHFLTEWREFRGFTKEEAADRVGVDRTTIGRLEDLKSPYNQDILERLAFAYSCEPEDLISVNPNYRDAPALVYEKLRTAPKAVQDRAAALIDAILKAG